MRSRRRSRPLGSRDLLPFGVLGVLILGVVLSWDSIRASLAPEPGEAEAAGAGGAPADGDGASGPLGGGGSGASGALGGGGVGAAGALAAGNAAGGPGVPGVGSEPTGAGLSGGRGGASVASVEASPGAPGGTPGLVGDATGNGGAGIGADGEIREGSETRHDGATGGDGQASDDGDLRTAAERATDDARARAERGAQLALERAWEAEPHDVSKLRGLVDWLLEHGRVDAAHEWVVRFGESGGDRELAAEWAAPLDPFLDRRATVLADGALARVALAETCLAERRWLNAAALLDAAALLLDGARFELAPEQQLADATAAVDAMTERLYASSSAVEALADWDVPLPESLTGQTRSQRRRSEELDAELEARGLAHDVRSEHYAVRTTVGSRVGELAAALLEKVYDDARRRFGTDPLRLGEPVKVDILGELSTFETRRDAADVYVGKNERGFHDIDARELVVLDPRVVGGSLDELWSVLARESVRPFLAAWGDGLGLAPWLTEAHAIDYERATVRADGEIVLDGLFHPRQREIASSLVGGGLPTRPIDAVLEYDGDAVTAPWTWALLHYLREARDADDELLWADRLNALLDHYTNDDVYVPGIAFQQFVLVDADGRRGTAIDMVDFQKGWHAWLIEQGDLSLGTPAAVDAMVAHVRRLFDGVRYDDAAEVLRTVLAVAPEHEGAVSLAVKTAVKRRKGDEALLFARNLAALRMPAGSWEVRAVGDDAVGQGGEASAVASPPVEGAAPTLGQDVDASLASARRAAADADRFAEAIEQDRELGEAFAEADLALRTDVEQLVDAMLAADRPRAAARLLARVIAMQPLDVGYLSMRAAIRNKSYEARELLLRHRLTGLVDLAELNSDRIFWEQDEVGFFARCLDQPAPVQLKGLTWLQPPWRVTVKLQFQKSENGRLVDDGTNFAGLLFGGLDPVDPGSWGVLATPRGGIELATRGRLEWPSEPIGRGRFADVTLEVRVEGDQLEILADGESLGTRPLGTRPGAGWLAFYVRQVDVRFENAVVTRSRVRDPRTVWFVGGRAR